TPCPWVAPYSIRRPGLVVVAFGPVYSQRPHRESHIASHPVPIPSPPPTGLINPDRHAFSPARETLTADCLAPRANADSLRLPPSACAPSPQRDLHLGSRFAEPVVVVAFPTQHERPLYVSGASVEGRPVNTGPRTQRGNIAPYVGARPVSFNLTVVK